MSTPRRARSGLAAAAGVLLALASPRFAAAQAPVPEPLPCPGTLIPTDVAAGDQFGCGVALSGATLVVGAGLDDDRGADTGSVYVFHYGSAGAALEAHLTAADGAPGDHLGCALATTGDRFLAGAPLRDEAGVDSGSAYVFHRVGGGWVQEAKLLPSGLGAGDRFGSAVALSGGVAVVGAPGDDDHGVDAGAVYVFTLGANGWALARKLIAAHGAAGDGLGSSVAVSDEALLAGAPFAGGGADGVVSAFRGGGGTWSEFQALTADAGQTSSLFGSSLALRSGVALVGARRDGRSGTGAGTAYLFRQSGPGGTWLLETRLSAPLAAGDDFGSAVGIDGDSALVGSHLDDAGAADSGAAYLFARENGQWAPRFKIKAAHPAAGEGLGSSVTLDGGAWVVGAPGSGGGSACLDRPQGGGGGPGPQPQPRADLQVAKTAAPMPAVPGAGLTFTVAVTNAGPDAVSGAGVSDTPPPGLSCAWSCSAAGGGSCGVGPPGGPLSGSAALPAGATATYLGACTVASSLTAPITNTATVTPPGGVRDPVPANNTATVVVPAAPSADLGVTVSAIPSPATPGQAVTYGVTVINAGPSDAAAVAVSDPGAAGLTCTWTCAPGAGAACTAGPVAGSLHDLATLPALTAVTYTGTCAIDPSATAPISTSATVSPPSGVTDPVLANNESGVTVPLVPRAELGLTKEVAAIDGDLVTFRVAVRNSGPSTASGVTLADPTPEGVLFAAATAPCSGGFPCALGSLPPGGDPVVVQVSFTSVPDCAAPGPRPVANTATVSSPVAAPVSASAQATLPAPLCPIDLAINKTDGQAVTIANSPLMYSIMVSNAGPENVVGAAVVDTFPNGLVGVNWNCPGAAGAGNLFATIDLAAGQSVNCSVTALVSPAFFGALINTATVESPGGYVDTNVGNNSSTDVTIVFPQQGGAASKRLLPGPHGVGSIITYEVLLLNSGPLVLPDLPADEFVDNLPAGVTLISAVSSLGVANSTGPTVHWNGTLQPEQFATITIQASVDPGTVGSILCNQGLFSRPPDPPALTDDPSQPGTADPTCFTVQSVVEVPALSPIGLALFALLAAAAGFARLRRG